MSKSLTIDFREPDSLKQLLADIGTVATLESGDYVWSTSSGMLVGIERKSITDLLSHIFTTLPNQLVALQQAVDVPILLIEGIVTKSIAGHCRVFEVSRDGFISPINIGRTRGNNIIPIGYEGVQDALLNLQKT